MTDDLVAHKGCCEEASVLSHNHYIPCNAPAVVLIDNGDRRQYRMCQPCAQHNIHNRGARLVRPLTKTEMSTE